VAQLCTVACVRADEHYPRQSELFEVTIEFDGGRFDNPNGLAAWPPANMSFPAYALIHPFHDVQWSIMPLKTAGTSVQILSARVGNVCLTSTE